MKDAPSSPGASAVILDWVRVDDDQHSTSSEYVRLKVFNDDGKKYGDVEVPYSPAYPFNGRIDDIAGRTIAPNGTITPFDGKVYDKVLYRSGRLSLRAKTFSLPNVQPGSILEYRFNRRWAERLLVNTLWSVQREIPVLHSKFTLTPYDSDGEFGSYFTYMGLPTGKIPVKVRNSYELELTNTPAFQPENFAPPEEQLKARVNFYYTTSRLRPEQFWSGQAAMWSKKIESFIGRSETARSEGARLKGDADSLAKIYARTQALRNYSFESARSEAEIEKQNTGESKNVEEVLRKGAGYRHEINRAFVAMARAAGFDADAVRVAPRDTFFFSQNLPDADQMSGEVAVVTLEGKPFFLDPGTPSAPFGTLSWEKTNVPGFRVTKSGPTWLETPYAPASAAVTKRTADLHVDGDAVEGTVTVTFTGQEALVRRLRGVGDDDAARQKTFEEELRKWFPPEAVLSGMKISGVSAHDQPLVATFAIRIPGYVTRAGSRLAIPVSFFASRSANPFAPATRTHMIYFPYARSEEDDVRFTLPPSLEISVAPPPVSLKAGDFRYASETKTATSEVTFHRTMVIDAIFVEAKYYTPLRTFFGAVVTADQKVLLLSPKNH